MYTVCFYSFKGGVGRTLALANVAVELVKRGKKVFLIDFDLEAPGLDTFDFCGTGAKSKGVVDLVVDYKKSLKSPEIGQYYHVCRLDQGASGQLFVMPAGDRCAEYSKRLNSINWPDLYEKKSGFLLFEDVKDQIRQLGVDYLLIDSRTGHSDVEGICTRQLPDAVVFLYFPNVQNLNGLEEVISRLRDDEKNRGIVKQKHFVVSNIPDLDDEDRILESRLNEFSNKLGYSGLPIKIHRYNSLALLNQSVFTLDRPNTRLAQEYRSLTDAIVEKNIEDKSAAILNLREILKKYPFDDGDTADHLRKVNDIVLKHKKSQEVLYMASIIKERYGDIEEAFRLLNAAIEYGLNDGGAYIRRARLAYQCGDERLAKLDLERVLSMSGNQFSEVAQAVGLAAWIDPKVIDSLPEKKGVVELPPGELVDLVYNHLQHDRATLPVAERLLLNCLAQPARISDQDRFSLTLNVGIIKIASGEFQGASMLFSSMLKEIQGQKAFHKEGAVRFNLAMSVWGESGKPPVDYLKDFLAVMSNEDLQSLNPNAKQCLALALGITGDISTAEFVADDAKSSAAELSLPQFSAWSYLNEDSSDFVQHIAEMKSFIKQGAPLPVFLRQNTLELF